MDSSFFSENRSRLAASLKGGLAVLTANTKMQGMSDAASPFEQEANFWWLSGIDMPDWWLIIDGLAGKSWLVAPKVEESHQLFDGNLSAEQAARVSGVDGILERDEALDKLRGFAKKHPLVHTLGEPPYAKYVDFVLNPAPKKMNTLLERTFTSVTDCRKDLSRFRAIKQPEEVAAITKAVNLTADAFSEVKEALSSYRYEYEAEAGLTCRFRRHGGKHAFAPIVASGKDACTLHYDKNAKPIGKRQLVLIDAGVRLGGYPADITRTFAVGDITKRQAAVHQAVQEAERRIIRLIRPDVRLEDYIRDVDDIMKKTLISLGLMRTKDDDSSYRRYFPHAISHGLGVDVHDSLGGWTYLQPGMILTVEPGIYIPEEGFGVRIEDDILVTKDGRRNLSARLSTEM